MNLSAAAGLVALPAQSYDKPGTSTYRRHVPAAAYQYETVPVDFTPRQSYSPGADSPGLGVLVTTAGFEAARP